MVAYNWADLETIMASNNPPCNDATDKHRIFCNMAGDFWIKPPKAEYINTHFEDIYGTWLLLGTYPKGPLPEYDPIPYDKAFSGVTTGPKAEAKTLPSDKRVTVMRAAEGYVLHFGRMHAEEFSVYNAAGKKVYTAFVNGQDACIPLSLHGAYIISITCRNRQFTSCRLIL
jgi:hypothetical protein